MVIYVLAQFRRLSTPFHMTKKRGKNIKKEEENTRSPDLEDNRRDLPGLLTEWDLGDVIEEESSKITSSLSPTFILDLPPTKFRSL